MVKKPMAWLVLLSILVAIVFILPAACGNDNLYYFTGDNITGDNISSTQPFGCSGFSGCSGCSGWCAPNAPVSYTPRSAPPPPPQPTPLPPLEIDVTRLQTNVYDLTPLNVGTIGGGGGGVGR